MSGDCVGTVLVGGGCLVTVCGNCPGGGGCLVTVWELSWWWGMSGDCVGTGGGMSGDW